MKTFSLINPAKTTEEWLDNFHILKKYWHDSDLGGNLWDKRTPENKRIIDELIHETNCNIATLNSWERNYQERDLKPDYHVLVRLTMQIFTYVCAAEMLLELENK